MFKQIYDKKNDILILQRNILFCVSIILLIIVFLLSICLAKKDINTILIPFGFNNKIEISTNRPQNSYLEAISRDVITTMLNLTPNNVDYAEKTILSFSNGKSYGILKNYFSKIKQDIIAKKISTVFYPISIYSDNQNLKVIVEGLLYNYLGQKEVSNDKKKYEIRYNYSSGNLSIAGFTEIIEKNEEELK